MLQAVKLKGQGHLSPLALDIELQELVFALLDWPWATLVFPHYATISPFRNGNVNSVSLYVGGMHFYFTGSYN